MTKFKTYKHIDHDIFRREAFSILIPEGWNVSGGLIWRQHATMPGAINLSIRSTDGLYELNILPSMPYYWNKNSFAFMKPKSGSYYMGNEVRQPAKNFAEYVQQYIIPKGGFNSKIIGTKMSNELEQSVRMENPVPFGCSVNISAGICQLEYEYKGYYFEGDISCAIVTTNMMYGQTSWISDKIISTRYPKGKRAESQKLFATMIKSFRFDIQWFNLYHQYVQQLTQYVMQDIFNAGVISKIISSTSNQISDTVKRSYENQQASNDRVFRGISEGIRGVNSYYDPYKGYAVEFPVDYRYVFSNSLGEYFVTDNPNINPNVGSNLNWTILNRN